MTPRGGARPGAGRPKGEPKSNLCIRLPADLDAWVRREALERNLPISKIIEMAVRQRYTVD